MSIDLRTFEPRKILVCQLRQIGDVVISTSCIELLHKRYPDALIDLYTEAKCAPLVRHNPAIHHIWEVDPQAGWLRNLRLYCQVAAGGYDMIVDFQRLPRCRWPVLLSRAKVKLCGPGKWYHRLIYTHSHGITKGGYAGALKASVLEALGIAWNREPSHVYLTGEERAWAKAHLAAQGLAPGHMLVTVDATHRRETRRWLPEYYAEVLRRAALTRGDLRFYLLYGPGERDLVEKIAELSGLDRTRLLYPPEDHEPDLREMAAVINEAVLHFGNCSAPRHVAAALGVPTLTMIGSNGPSAWTFPAPEHETAFLRLPCRKCNKEVCPTGTLACLRDQTPDMILPRLLARIPASTPAADVGE